MNDEIDEKVAELEELVSQAILEDDVSGYGGEDCMYPVANGNGKWAVGITQDQQDGSYNFEIYEMDGSGQATGVWGPCYTAADAIKEAKGMMAKQMAEGTNPPPPAPGPAVDQDRLYDLHGKGPRRVPEEHAEYQKLMNDHKTQNGKLPGYMASAKPWMVAWVNRNCKFAFDAMDQGPLVGDPRSPRTPAKKPIPVNQFPSPVSPTKENIDDLIREYERSRNPAIKKQLVGLGWTRDNSTGGWRNTRAAAINATEMSWSNCK